MSPPLVIAREADRKIRLFAIWRAVAATLCGQAAFTPSSQSTLSQSTLMTDSRRADPEVEMEPFIELGRRVFSYNSSLIF
jgi:hypothetical protein